MTKNECLALTRHTAEEARKLIGGDAVVASLQRADAGMSGKEVDTSAVNEALGAAKEAAEKLDNSDLVKANIDAITSAVGEVDWSAEEEDTTRDASVSAAGQEISSPPGSGVASPGAAAESESGDDDESDDESSGTTRRPRATRRSSR